MNMEKVTKQQICHMLGSIFSTFLPITILVLVLFSLFFFFFSVSESSPYLFTLLIALLSTMLLVTLIKKKGSLPENLAQDNNMHKPELQPSIEAVTQTEATKQSETAQRQEQKAEAQSHSSSFQLDSESSNIMDENLELNAEIYEQEDDQHSDSSLPSDNESSTTGSIIGGGSFEIDHSRNQDMNVSDSLDDDDEEEEDEDGLIEIKLASSNFSGLTEDPKEKFETDLPEYIFKQQGLMELLAEINEMNEDENLIEIDISKGSTKYQDFRFEELACLGDQCVLSD